MGSRKLVLRLLTVGAVVLASAVSLAAPAGAAARPESRGIVPARTLPAAAAEPRPGDATAALSGVQRARVLGKGYRSSNDQLWTTTSGAEGVGVLRASVSQGAPWLPVARLWRAGIESRQWVSHACQIAGTHSLAVAYGPVEYLTINRMYESGGYAAIVDLDTGRVRSLPVRPTFSYFSPTCGADGRATFTSFGPAESSTRARSFDEHGRQTSDTGQIAGEFIDAISTATHGTVATSGARIVRLSHGSTRPLTTASGTVYDLYENAARDLVWITDSTTRSVATAWHAGTRTPIADAPRGNLGIDGDSDGDAVVHGSGLKALSTRHHISVSSAAADTQPSRHGSLFTRSLGQARVRGGVQIDVQSASDRGARVTLPDGLATASGTASAQRAQAAAATSSSSTTDANLPCAVQRNDVSTEAYQPSAAQVEWAVDQAVTGHLTVSRAANYRHFGLPAYSPQGLAPLKGITGGGNVPPQIMLGILANESNLWQASSHVGEGGYGNPLTGNIYGRDFSTNDDPPLAVDFTAADCGYGISQVTDGMRKGNQSATTQRAIALDYQVNIAAGINILISKWNQLKGYSPPITMNDGSAKWLENWYAAAWAYNSGLQPNAVNGNTTGCTPGPSCTDSGGRWGLGWANNPSNPIYPANRHMFNLVPEDATSPGSWPYQERVLGWAAYPIYKDGGSYQQAYWLSSAYRDAAIPDSRLFCTSANLCSPGSTARSQGTCSRSDLHCWLHAPVKWKDCASSDSPCGFAQTKYATSDAQPADPKPEDTADCTRGDLPGNAVVVDDVSSAAPSPYSPCGTTGTSGSFGFSFPSDANGNQPAHIDLHQINGGLDGHYWFQHSSKANDLTVGTGTWTFPSSTAGWGRVMVHVPALGAQTLEARYDIVDGATGTVQTRTLNQYWGSNHWFSLGAAQFSANEKIRLSAYSPHDGGYDLAWDAVAFVPSGKPKYKVVAMGDSYSAGEGLEPYYGNSNTPTNSCHRSSQAYSALMKLPGETQPLLKDPNNEYDFIACSGATTTGVAPESVTATSEKPPGSTWDSPTYQHGEELQTKQGYLDAGTDAVTITIGGNDARFADVLTSCILSVHYCSKGTYTMQGDPKPLNTYEPHILTDLMPAHLAATYKAIHAAAPNAQIFVLTYPLLFPSGGGCGVSSGVTSPDQDWINQMTGLMDTSIGNTVTALAKTGIAIHTVDTRSAFAGHSACDDDSWINAIIAYSNDAKGRHVPGTGSYHPKNNGHQAMADLMTSALATYLPRR